MPPAKNLQQFRNQKVKKKFPVGKHAKLVALTDKGIVKKAYHVIHRDIFQHEVDALRKLQTCKFVPRLLCVDEEKRTLYMNYCGRPLNNFGPYRQKIKKYLHIMEQDYGVYHNDIREGNICLHKGQIYFIDFGWARDYPGIGGYGEGKIGHPDHSNNQVEEIIYDNKERTASRQDLLNLLMSVYVSNELKSDYLLQRVKEILIQEKLLGEDEQDEEAVGEGEEDTEISDASPIMDHNITITPEVQFEEYETDSSLEEEHHIHYHDEESD